jgi:hypothetical protein
MVLWTWKHLQCLSAKSRFTVQGNHQSYIPAAFILQSYISRIIKLHEQQPSRVCRFGIGPEGHSSSHLLL